MPFSGDDDHQTLVKVAKADWDFDDECFDDLSHDAMEFIEGLLVKEPRYLKHVVTGKCGSVFYALNINIQSCTSCSRIVLKKRNYK